MSMKLRKNLGRIATAFVATAMLASLSAVPASAATTTPGSMDYTDNTVSFDATIDMTDAQGAGMPYGTWIFTLGELTVLPEPDADKGAGILGEVEDVVNSQETVTFDGETEKDLTTGKYTETVTFEFRSDAFEHAGIYYYTVKQEDPSISGMTADTATYIMKVYVQNVTGGTLKVANVTMYKEGAENPTDDAAKVGGIENAYATESLKLTKNITGDAANLGEKFSFTITLTDPDKLNHATQVSYQINGTGETKPIDFINGVANINITDALSKDEYITVTGLPVGTDYTIEETDAADYKTTWKADGTTISTENADTQDTKKIVGDTQDGENKVTVTNVKEAVSPTGIVMNVAPYALLVVVAAGACFVFLRKRRED